MFLWKRRTRDSNPQPREGHLISSETPLGVNPEENAHSQKSAAQGAAADPANATADPDLSAISTAWDTLPDAVKVGILAMVNSVTK